MINKKISVILPCYNEAENIPVMHEKLTKVLKGLTKNYEIIFVENGSTDNSYEVFDKVLRKDKNSTVIRLSRPFAASQGAFAAGMAHATGDCVINMDADGEDPPEVIPDFIKMWEKGADIVYGVRRKRKVSFFRNISYKMFYRIMRKISYIKIPVDAGEFALMDRKVVDAINSLPEKDRFLRGLRAWVGFRTAGVKYDRKSRIHGETSNSFFDNLRWAFKMIFSFSYFPLILISYIAFFTFGFSMLAILYYLIVFFLTPNPPQGITTIIILVLFLGSIQLLSISAIGGYISKIFQETKSRPAYIVEKVFKGKIEKKKR